MSFCNCRFEGGGSIFKIGVFTCHCDENISTAVDCKKMAETVKEMEGVAYIIDRKYICSDPGQTLIKNTTKKYGLDGVVVAACSPRIYGPTFRGACAGTGLNPYLCEIASTREHCSQIHERGETTAHKAVNIVKSLVEKVKWSHPSVPTQVPITKKALVIGRGTTGIQAGLSIANYGYQVILMEKEPSIGRHMPQLSETFPTLDCSQCILTSRMAEVAQHPSIILYTCAELEHVGEFIDDFKASVRLKAKSIDEELHTDRRLCMTKCLNKKIPSEFNAGSEMRTTIYVPFPQTAPNKPVIDKEHYIHYHNSKRGVCEKLHPAGAIRLGREDYIITEEVGAITVATGFDVLNIDFFPEYGYGKYKDVAIGLQFERLAPASGPVFGEIHRPSDGQIPQKIIFVACTDSHDPARGIPYYSKVYCVYTTKHAILYQHKAHGSKSYVFYVDIRVGGKNCRESVRRAIGENRVNYIRGRVVRIYERNGKLIAKGVDTLLGVSPVKIEAGMIALTTVGIANKETEELAQKIHTSCGPYQFSAESHPRLRPVETNTAGIYLTGAYQAPKDVSETVGMASGAVIGITRLFSQANLVREPLVVVVNRAAPPLSSTRMGCLICQTACPHQAIEREEVKDRNGNIIEAVAKVSPELYQGCSTCIIFCRSKSIDIRGYSGGQVYVEVMTLLNH